MVNNFLMNNLNDLLNSKPKSNQDISEKGQKLKKELIEQAKKVEKKNTKKTTKKTSKKTTKKKTAKKKKNELLNQTHDYSNINNNEYRNHLIDYINKNSDLGFDSISILEHLVEYGVDYNYANELINNVNLSKNISETKIVEKEEREIISKSQNNFRFFIELFIVFIIITILSLMSNGTIYIVAMSFFPTILNLCLIHYYFKNNKNYLLSIPIYLVIISFFSILFNYVQIGEIFLRNIIDIKAIAIYNIILTFIFQLVEFENLNIIFANLSKHFNFHKKENVKDLKITLNKNISILKKKILKINQLIESTYKINKKELNNVLIDLKYLKKLENIDYKNLILKAHNYFEISDLLEKEIKKLENDEKFFNLNKKAGPLKRDKSGRYSILSIIMVNNHDIDLKKLWEEIFFIIDTIKGELYNNSI
ncbi:hypothetical protein HOD31_02430 [Candidatus Woesearchaeota archaeon]|nr:hypothetical protein [Candidatus Woesearchaeota archaeon]